MSEHAQYHHGEASLMGAIIGMAQTFVGSNNINLLFPSGQFGTRLMGGSDAASPRYIFTKVCIQPYKNLLILNIKIPSYTKCLFSQIADITRAIFHADDDPILEYMEEDGINIEPQSYAPIIPMALVNGTFDSHNKNDSSKINVNRHIYCVQVVLG